MSDNTMTTGIEAAQAALDAEAIARLDAVEAEYEEAAARLRALQEQRAAEQQALAAEYGPKREALQRQRELADMTAQVEAKRAAHAEAAPLADAAYARVTKAREDLAAALAEFWPAELARVQAGAAHQAAVRAINDLQPGHATPDVPAKRLADRRADAIDDALRGLAFAAHPDAERVLQQLQQHEAYREPHYAYVQGQRVQVS